MSGTGETLRIFEVRSVTREGAVNEVCIYKVTLLSSEDLKTI